MAWYKKLKNKSMYLYAFAFFLIFLWGLTPAEAGGSVNDSAGFNWTVLLDTSGAAVNDSAGFNWTVFTRAGGSVNDSAGFNWTVNAASFIPRYPLVPSASTPTASTGGGAGGGGGGVKGSLGETKSTIVIGEVAAGQVKTIDNSDTKSEIIQVVLETTKTLSDVKLTVTTLTEAPAAISAPVGKIYKYLEITVPQADESIIKRAEIKFKVEKRWLADNNLDKNSVVLARHTQAGWQELSTVISGEDAIYAYYTSQTPGFSTFVIVAKRLATGELVDSENAVEELQVVQPEVQRLRVASSTFIIVIIIALGAVLYLIFMRRVRGKRSKKRR